MFKSQEFGKLKAVLKQLAVSFFDGVWNRNEVNLLHKILSADFAVRFPKMHHELKKFWDILCSKFDEIDDQETKNRVRNKINIIIPGIFF